MSLNHNLILYVFAYKDIDFENNDKMNEFIRKCTLQDKELKEQIILIGVIGLVN